MAGHDHAPEYHTVPVLGDMEKSYVRIWGILVVLFIVSWVGPEVAEVVPIPGLLFITAFGIAFVKAWLVIKHFMHVPMEQPIVHYILVTCLVLMGLFFAGVSVDVRNHHGARWENVAAKAAIERGMEAGAAGGHGHHDEGHGASGDHGEHADGDKGHDKAEDHGKADDHGAAEGGH